MRARNRTSASCILRSPGAKAPGYIKCTLFSIQKNSLKDIPKLKAAKLDNKVKSYIDIIRENPFRIPPPYEKLQGDLQGALSRRINKKHRLVYTVDEVQKEIKLISMWSHYEF
ncbi:MAG: Txe/YoeB family addiction module toxin [Chitinispirillia bacterium]|nr:Txe/YoeB family addiction module toxin [Chitinispirillia bacterium]